MISAKSTEFKYINRNKSNLIVLVPGWATDYRIFDSLDLNFNYLLPVSFSPWGFTEDLADYLAKNNISKISLFGYSLGGFIAAEFAFRYSGLIDELILVSIRKRYTEKEIAEVRKSLKKNKRAYLYKFYSSCFYQKSQMKHFKETLLKDYLDRLSKDYLLSTLDYLGGCELKPELLKDIKNIKVIHGQEDKIAPIREAIEIKNNLPQAKFTPVKNAGHIIFYRDRVSITEDG